MVLDLTWPRPDPERIRLLSAGPGAGKTRLLLQWRDSAGMPSLYLRLSPEDRHPELLRHRLMRAIASTLPPLLAPAGRAWGEELGRRLPPCVLLVDEWHAIEGTESERQLTALVWHLPAGATAALASRHRFDPAIALSADEWGPDHPAWRERPTMEDLDGQPEAVRDHILAMALVGEAPDSPDGRELIRRNVADELAAGRLTLRVSWADLARDALAIRATQRTWEHAEALLEAFVRHHKWTLRDPEIGGILGRFPSDLQEQSPALLAIRGRIDYDAGDYGAALDCFDRALALWGPDRPGRKEVQAKRYMCLASLGREPSRAELDELEARGGDDPDEAWRLHPHAMLLWYQGHLARARGAWRELLRLPIAADRARAHLHFRAHLWLSSLAGTRSDGEEACRQSEALAKAWDFSQLLHLIALERQRLLLNDERRIPPSERQGEVPNAAFAAPSRKKWVANFIALLGKRASLIGEDELALRLFELNEAIVMGMQLGFGYWAGVVRTYQIAPLVRLDRLGQAMRISEEFAQAWPAMGDALRVQWMRSHLGRGDLEAARRLLFPSDRPPGEGDDASLTGVPFHLFREGLLLLEGDPEAADRLRAWLETPEGAPMREREALFLQRLGLCTVPPAVRLWAFGRCEISREDRQSSHWPRRKALVLLAHLIVRPDGAPADELAAQLFEKEGKTPPLQVLHIVANALRHVLRSIGAEDLLETQQGLYRLRWDGIAFCDLHEFDAFYQRARSFEADGMKEMAAVFYGIALCHARGELFENLPEEFGALRTAYRKRIRYAQACAARLASLPASVILPR